MLLEKARRGTYNRVTVKGSIKPGAAKTSRLTRSGARLRGLPIWLFAAAIALVPLSLVRANEPPKAPQTSANSANTDYLPDVPLIDQAGRHFSLASMKGKPVLVGFIHTSCQGACQLMTAKMKSVASDLEPAFASKITMVSLTTDPKEDGPAQLAAYAKTQGATGDGWVFLTGKPADVRRVLNLYGVVLDASEDSMTHVFELRLIGRNGHELHRYEGSEIKAASVTADIKKALVHD
jgi:protein SCO1